MTVHNRHNTVSVMPIDSIKPQVIGYNGCRLGLAAEKYVPQAYLPTSTFLGLTALGAVAMAHEEWRDVVGYEGYYQVSNLGRVRSLDRSLPTSTGLIRHYTGKELKQRVNANGYLTVSITFDGRSKSYLVHRLVAEAFIDNADMSLNINHINGVIQDNRVENLQAITVQERMALNQEIVVTQNKPVDEITDLDGEEWRPIDGYEGAYEVSNLGRVKSVGRIVKRASSSMRIQGRILKPVINEHGYEVVHMRKGGKVYGYLVHRLVAAAFLPQDPDPDRWIVDHIDGIKTHNYVSNLRYCSYKENHQYAVELGLIDPNLIGEHSKRKPNGAKPVIRSDGKYFSSAREADRALGVSYGTVSSQLRGYHKTCCGYTFKYAEQAS